MLGEVDHTDTLTNAHHENVTAFVDVVIVNWNSGIWLSKCLKSIHDFGRQAVASVTVVDNGSVDGSDKQIFRELPLEIVQTNANLGFGRACNLGVGHGHGPYILFLNPDAALFEGTLQTAVSFLDDPGNAAIGVCGIRLIEEDGTTQKHTARFPTVGRMLAACLGITRLFPKAALHDHEFDHLSSRDVDHVIGAFYLIRRSLFENLGGFDPRFFVYLEDLDLSLRVRQAGFRIHYLADAVGFHKGGGTSEQVKAHRLFYSMDSRLFYVFKHLSLPAAWLIAIITLVVEPMPRLARAAIRRSPVEAKDTLRAFKWLWQKFVKNPGRYQLTTPAKPNNVSEL